MSVRSTRADVITVLELAHGRANAFDIEFLTALRRALDEAAKSDARGLVITAAGGIFSAGVDLLRLQAGDRAYLESFLAQLSDALEALFMFPRPVVAAVNGHAIAGGAIIVCACDYRIMASGAGTIGVPELRVGVPFPLVPAEIVRYALGPQRAQRAMLMGHVVPAEHAIAEGYIDELVPQDRLMERALATASAMAATPPTSYARTKADLRRPVRDTWSRLRSSHDPETLECWESPEVRRAIDAYVSRTLKK